MPDAERIDFILPGAREVQALQGQQYSWILDFTEGGKYPGVVMSQARMREIEFVLNPFGGENMGEVPMMSFGGGSWLDLLVSVHRDCGISTCAGHPADDGGFGSLMHKQRSRLSGILRST